MQNQTHPDDVPPARVDILETDVQLAVSQGGDVRENVRKLTYDALSLRALDSESLRRIIASVVEGARQGVQQELQHTTDQAKLARSRFEQAIGGLDAALAQFAEAAKLTLEETVSRAQIYSSEDLAKARSDLESLESLFLETLKGTAKATQGFLADALHDLLDHAERQGTAVGRQLQETLASFSRHLAEAGLNQLETGLKFAHSTSKLMRDIAAGVLGGFADRLKTHRNSDSRAD